MKQLSNVNEIPKHWQRTTLGKILTISSGNGLTKSKRNDEGEYLVYGGNGVTGKHSEFLFEEEKLIIGRVGVHCGNAYITKPKSWVTDNAFVVSFDETEINKNFLLYLIGVLNLNKYSVSTAQPVISQGKLYPIEVALPPLSEQQAIVAKIEELLSDLENGKQQLQTAQQQLKVYRQSLMKWAFEGKLTNKNVRDGELPKGWKRVSLKDVCEKIETVKRKEKNPEEELLYLDIGGIDNNTNKILSHKTYKWKDAPSRAQQIVFVEDILFSTVRTYMKNIAVVENKIFDGQIASSGFCVIRGNKKIVTPKYIFYYSISQIFLQPLNKLQTGSSYPAVRDKDVFSQQISLPNILEQKIIVEELESKLTVCDKIEETITNSLLQAESLRQSILKKAFEGKLVKTELKTSKKKELV